MEASSNSRLAAVAIAALVTLPFLYPYHAPPLLTFHAEAFTFALAALFVLSVFCRPLHALRLPVFLWPLLGLVLYVSITGIWNVYPTRAYVTCIYIMAAGLAAYAAANVQDSATVERYFINALAIGGFLVACSGFLEYFNVGFLQTARNVSMGMMGTLGQPNMFAAYVACGLAALFVVRVQPAIAAAPAMLMGMALAYSAARISWVFILIAALPAAGSRERMRLWYFAFAAFVIVQCVPDAGVIERAPDLASAFDQAVMPRFAYVREALQVWWDYPTFGAGIGELGYQMYMHTPNGTGRLPMLERHAHNVFAQLLAETGIVGLALFVAVLVTWFNGVHGIDHRRTPRLSSLLAAVLLIVTAYSLTEFPLWHAQFLLLTAFALGFMPQASPIFTQDVTTARALIVFPVLCFIVCLVGICFDYVQFERFINGRQQAIEVSSSSFRPNLEMVLAAGIESENPERDLALVQKALHAFPRAELLCKQAELLYRLNRASEADLVLARMLRRYEQPDCLITK